MAAHTYVQDQRGSNAVLVVTGHGSLLTNETGFLLGYGGSSNSLFVSDGGVLADGSGYLGPMGFGGNQAVIAGTGAVVVILVVRRVRRH